MAQDWFNDSLLASVKVKWVTEGKRCRALMQLYNKIPDVLDETPVTAIFAPDAGGLCTRASCAEIMIYLAPELELESQEQVNFTVAHEFAHVVLKHSFLIWNLEQNRCDEQMADNIAKEWGFERPKQPYKVNKEMLTVYRKYLLTTCQDRALEDGLSLVSSS
jgi:hypothetical protein